MVGAHVQSPIAISYGDALFVDHVPALQYHGYWPSASRSRSTVKVTGATDASDSVEPHAHDVVPYVRVADQLSDSKSNTAESSAWLRATVTSKISPANATISGGHALCSLENTGQSALLRFECLQRERMPFVRGGMLPQQNRYIFEQLHFHWAAGDALGSEHMIEHQKYSMEAHLVHYNAAYRSVDEAANHPDGLVVVAFFMQASGAHDCPYFGTITDQLANVSEPMAKCNVEADCLQWLQQQELSKRYFVYRGSLTTPPYNECVTWIIYPAPLFVSHRQVSAFRQLRSSSVDPTKFISHNCRPLQMPAVDMPRTVFVRSVLKSKL